MHPTTPTLHDSITPALPHSHTPSLRLSGLRLRLHKYRHAHPDQLRKIFRVPVREAKTAVRFGAPDLFRSGRPVNTIAGSVQADPDGADRIVRPRRQDQFA